MNKQIYQKLAQDFSNNLLFVIIPENPFYKGNFILAVIGGM